MTATAATSLSRGEDHPGGGGEDPEPHAGPPPRPGGEGVPGYQLLRRVPRALGYGEIAEASTTHTPDLTGEQEVWTDYVKDTTAESGRWVTIGGERYYIDR